MVEKILAQAAESIIIKQDDKIIKRRIKKGYRIPEIDEKLRKLRTRSEAKIIERLQDKINVPKIISVNEISKEIVMEFIEGKKLSDNLDLFPVNQQIEVCKEIGKEVGKMHDENIIHGDLTTSNMILQENCCKISNNKELCCTNKGIQKNNIKNLVDNNKLKDCCPDKLTNKKLCYPDNKKGSRITNKLVINNSEIPEQEEGMEETKIKASEANKCEPSSIKIVLIDFGLSFHSIKIEDKAVDIHLFRQALESKHFQNWEKLYKSFTEGYNPKDKTQILKQLEKVELRGRYRKH